MYANLLPSGENDIGNGVFISSLVNFSWLVPSLFIVHISQKPLRFDIKPILYGVSFLTLTEGLGEGVGETDSTGFITGAVGELLEFCTTLVLHPKSINEIPKNIKYFLFTIYIINLKICQTLSKIFLSLKEIQD
jgi:hypothetical protein